MKNIANIIRMPLLTSLLMACGAENEIKQETQTACPSSVHFPNNQISIQSSTIPPANLALELNGVRKWDSCSRLETPPPYASLSKSQNQINIQIKHMENQRSSLPSSIFLRIINQADCQGSEITYFERNIALEYSQTHPHGPQCGSALASSNTVQKSD